MRFDAGWLVLPIALALAVFVAGSVISLRHEGSRLGEVLAAVGGWTAAVFVVVALVWVVMVS